MLPKVPAKVEKVVSLLQTALSGSYHARSDLPDRRCIQVGAGLALLAAAGAACRISHGMGSGPTNNIRPQRKPDNGKSRKPKREFADPKLPLHLLALAAGLAAGGAVLGRRKSLVFNFGSWGLFVRSASQSSPVLPKKEGNKITVFLDIDDILFRTKFDIWGLGYVLEKRPGSDVFLFHLSEAFEVVAVSSLDPEVLGGLLEKADPYGCISHALSITCPETYRIEQTGREKEKSVWIRSGKIRDTIDLSVGPWNGKEEDMLLPLLLDFLLNLNAQVLSTKSGVQGSVLSNVISTYVDKPFQKTYQVVQKRIYPAPRVLGIFLDPEGRKKRIAEAAEQRIREYKAAKEYIDNQLKIQKALSGKSNKT